LGPIPKRFALAVIAIQALGTAIALPVRGSFGLEGLWPPRFVPRFAPGSIPEYQLGYSWRPDAVTPSQRQVEGLGELAGVWLALGVVTLMITCVTLTVLVVRRGATRHDELALHAALGANRRDLLRALLRESVSLAAVGVALGGTLGLAGAALLRASWPVGLETPTSLSPLSLIAVAAPALTVLAAGLYPARHIRAWMRAPERVRSTRALWEQATIAGYVMGLVALLSVAGLLLRGYGARSSTLPPGLHTSDTLVIELDPQGLELADSEGEAMTLDVVALVASAPNVRAASLVSAGALQGLGMTETTIAECFCSAGLVAAPYILVPVQHHAASPGFFNHIGIPLLEGREFDEADRPGSPLVAVIDRALALRFRGVEPLGKRIRVGPRAGLGPLHGPWYEIVGVVESLVPQGLGTRGEPRPSIYLSVLQHTPTAATLLVTAQDSPASPGTASESGVAEQSTPGEAVVSEIESVLGRLAPGTGRAVITTLDETLDRFAAPFSWLAGLITILAVGVVALAIAGLKSAVSLEAWRRTAEIGVRRATGASRRDIQRLILVETARTAAVGLAIGVALAVGFARGLEVLVAGVEAWDPLIYAVVAVVVATTALAGVWKPARHASRLEPVEAIGTGE
jgi:putative ABC transport system permease protein